MKTIKGKLKLNHFSQNELDQRKMNALKGGCSCGPACSDCSSSCKTGTASYYEKGINALFDEDGYDYSY